MVSAVARLAAITAGVLILTLLAVIGVRRLGLLQEFQAPSHAWFSLDQWRVVALPDESICAGVVNRPGEIVLVRLRRSAEGQWQVPCKAPVPVAQVLASSSHPDWMLKIEANETIDLDKLVDNVSSHDKSMRFAVLAPAQKVARQLRKLAPQWLFAADSASLLRLHLFQSLRVEPVMDFWPDFVIASLNRTDGTRLSVEEAQELRRRKKRVLWNLTAEPNTEPPFPVDGRLTARP